MAYELYIILFGIVLIIALAALAVVRKSQREMNKMKLQQMLHEERMKAMEKGLEVPGEASRDVIEPEWMGSSVAGVESTSNSILWTRMVSLCLGLFLAFSGLGMFLGFAVAGDHDFHGMAALGLLPAFGGLGLILFYVLTRGSSQND